MSYAIVFQYKINCYTNNSKIIAERGKCQNSDVGVYQILETEHVPYKLNTVSC
jgi:hypothetical protein